MPLFPNRLNRKHALMFHILLGGMTAAIIARLGLMEGLMVSLPLSIALALFMRLIFGKVT